MKKLDPGITESEIKPNNRLGEDDLDAPIPTPLSERWRTMRYTVVQAVAFIIVCCGAALAWKHMARPLTFTGQVEIIQANVTSPETGLVTNVAVSSFQSVNAGMPVAELLCLSEQSLLPPVPKRIPLKAPISGIVSGIHRHDGEQVFAGQAVVTITAQECKRIIGFIPTSFPTVPEVGMKVAVRTRSRPRNKGFGVVVGIGPQWQQVTNVVGFSDTYRALSTAMIARPVAVSLPPGLIFTPGEPVDLTLLK